MAPRRLPPRLFEYSLPGGWRVLAGRTDQDNEKLSLEIARPEDWWFHVRGTPGSHVVLQGPEGDEADRATRRRAAAVAAYHSKARRGRDVSVSCTRARHVSKPRGAPIGTVEIRRETVVRVRPEKPTETGAEIGAEAAREQRPDLERMLEKRRENLDAAPKGRRPKN